MMSYHEGFNKDKYGYGIDRWKLKIQKKKQNTNSR